MDNSTEDLNIINPLNRELLEGLAIYGNDFPRARQARQLVRSLMPQTEDYQADAFRLLVEAGIFSPHENLILKRHLIPDQYPQEVLRELELILEYREQILASSDRTDLQHMIALAIDDGDTIEIDDAISAEHTPDGGVALAVHIADVAALVPLHGELDREAALRGTTVYLPDRKITMLPPSLSQEAGSLSQSHTRAAITFFIRLDNSGEVVDSSIDRSLVKVTRQLDYGQADYLLELVGAKTGTAAAAETEARARTGQEDRSGTADTTLNTTASPAQAPEPEPEHLLDTIGAIYKAAQLHRNKRLAAGAVTLNLPETKIHIDKPSGAISITRTNTLPPSRKMVAEIMIMVCHQAALFMAKNRLPALYRSQKTTGEIPPGATTSDSMEVHEIYALLRVMGKAESSTTQAPHAALGLDSYVQFTSPLRRYSDLAMQRQIAAFLAQKPLPYTAPMLEEQSLQWEAASASASKAERETRRYWLLQYLAQFQGHTESAIVLENLEYDQYRVELINVGVQGIINSEHPLKVGDKIQVVVIKSDGRRNRLTLKSAHP